MDKEELKKQINQYIKIFHSEPRTLTLGDIREALTDGIEVGLLAGNEAGKIEERKEIISKLKEILDGEWNDEFTTKISNLAYELENIEKQ